MRMFLLLFLAHLPLIFYAQGSTERFSGSLMASYSLPKGDFKTLMHGKGILGANLSVIYGPEAKLPLMVGLEVAYHCIDGDNYLGSGNLSYEKSATTNFISVFPKLRIQHPKKITVNPFAEAMVGVNFFYAYEKIVTDNYSSGKTRKRKIRDFSGNPGFGFAAGLNIPINKTGERLEIKSTYILGGRGTYYSDPVYSGTGELNYSTLKSRTDMLMFQVGINL
jgi:hypothetical protein